MGEKEDQQIADAAQFEELRKAGCDFSHEHKVDFLFYGDELSLRELEEKMLSQGFSLSPEQEKPNSLLFLKNMRLNLREMQVLTASLVELSEQTGTTYDGWGTVVKK